jgi:hypothetical protein
VSPWLPEWLPRLELPGIAIGGGSLDITIVRRGTQTGIEELERKEIEGKVEAPLWGKPPLESEQGDERGQESKPGYASVKEKGAQEDASKDT